MIELAGAAKLSLRFPAPLPRAYAYFSDLGFVLRFLPHIEVVKAFEDDHYRMRYSSLEPGGFQMRIICDIRALMEGGLHMIRLVPEEGIPPVTASSGVNSATARGFFSSRALFFDEGEETQIEYEFRLESYLPRPLSMRLMPSQVVNGVARNVAKKRMREIAAGFIERSLAEYPQWLARQGPGTAGY